MERGPRFEHLLGTCRTLVGQLESSDKTPLLTLMLEGPVGSGKSALAAKLALESTFPFVKMVSPDAFVGQSENYKCQKLTKTFEDSYKSPLSVIVLDDIERLLEYVSIGPRFSNVILQTLLVLIKRLPPEGHKLLVIGTTSLPSVMESMEINSAFNVVQNVPLLNPEDVGIVLKALNVFSEEDLQVNS